MIVIILSSVLTFNVSADDGFYVIPVQKNISLWSQSGDNIYYDGGNVGIGITNPEAKLHVAGELYVDQFATITGAQFNDNIHGGTNNMLSFISTLPNQDNASEITFTTSNGGGQIERMRIDADGNVGIGTTSPSETLEVVGNVKADQFLTGDIVFHKDNVKPVWRMYEDEKGLYVESLTTQKKYSVALKEIQQEGGETASINEYSEKINKLQEENNKLKNRLDKLEALFSVLKKTTIIKNKAGL